MYTKITEKADESSFTWSYDGLQIKGPLQIRTYIHNNHLHDLDVILQVLCFFFQNSFHLEASLFGSQIPPNERKGDTCVRCAKIMQHKCEIHSSGIKMATKILSCKESERIFLYTFKIHWMLLNDLDMDWNEVNQGSIHGTLPNISLFSRG